MPLVSEKEMRLNNQCFRLEPIPISKCPVSCWLNNCHPISRTGDNGGGGPRGQQHGWEKAHFSHHRSQVVRKPGSLRPINYKHCHFPRGVCLWRAIPPCSPGQGTSRLEEGEKEALFRSAKAISLKMWLNRPSQKISVSPPKKSGKTKN